MKVNSGLCQLTAAGTPMPTQIGCRLRVTFCVIDIETDILRPIHVSVERIVVFLTHVHVQATLNTLTLVFCPADTTRFARVAL